MPQASFHALTASAHGRARRRRHARGCARRGRRRRLRTLDPARRLALRDSWRALWSSRLLVWAAAVGTLLDVRLRAGAPRLQPAGLTRGFGWLGDLLAAPAARWDAAWYLVIAHYGYRPDLGAYTSSRAAFFPLYPLGLRALGALGVPPVLAGVLLSLAGASRSRCTASTG